MSNKFWTFLFFSNENAKKVLHDWQLELGADLISLKGREFPFQKVSIFYRFNFSCYKERQCLEVCGQQSGYRVFAL